MKSPHEKALRRKIGELQQSIQSLSFSIKISEESWKEYSVQIHFFDKSEECGHARLYFAPTKNAFRLDGRSIKNEDLRDLLGIESSEKTPSTKHKKSQHAKNHDGLHAYVDGSFIRGKVGYGLVIIQDNQNIFEDFGSVDNPEYQEARQVAGELTAVGKVLQWCMKHAHKSITVHYDYAGIEEWAKGRWRAKQPLTQRYAAFVASSGIKIHFNKIAAHTGDYWNEYADILAKKGTDNK